METSYFLAQILGPVILLMGAALLLNPKYYEKLFKNFRKEPQLLFLWSMIEIAVGTLIVMQHNAWEQSWILLITLFGWGMILEGSLILLRPAEITQWGTAWMKKSNIVLWSGILLLAWGGALSYFGYMA